MGASRVWLWSVLSSAFWKALEMPLASTSRDSSSCTRMIEGSRQRTARLIASTVRSQSERMAESTVFARSFEAITSISVEKKESCFSWLAPTSCSPARLISGSSSRAAATAAALAPSSSVTPAKPWWTYS